ncbi:MAG TPA: 16S rRNA (adenine(1518)-N(6)/adenine(1519)-N(6))-dimethyltransferase RsmA [Caulobacteraceae bacterium]|nr:16S rRNA (adenine(1518)-N(6)/adenine(1519)-N(6))-dimethyltransferase RsmA [Caulobacteraceae bacterium]
MNLEDLAPLRESLAAAGILARKSLGQHFLLDLNLTRKIARLAGVEPGQTIVEVGPGPGGLTRALLEAGASVVAIERDARFLPLLEDLAARAEGRLTVLHADALEADLPPGAPIVANLPYNVATPLLIGWLTAPVPPRSMTLMFQKEVADRIVAAPGSKAYGRLSVLAQALTDANVVMDLPARAFTPPPKVASAVVRLVPKPNRPAPQAVDRLQRVTAAAFGQRRKMLRSSLKALGGEALCAAAGLAPTARAEDLSVADFLTLAARLGEDAS